MKKFVSVRFNNRKTVFRNLAITLVLWFILFASDYLIDSYQLMTNFSYAWVLVFLMFTSYIEYSSKDYINHVIIDPANHQLIIQYYNYHKGQVENCIALDLARIKINKSFWSKSKETSSIYLFNGNKGFFEISKIKDGFSINTINSLGQYLESLTRPILNTKGA